MTPEFTVSFGRVDRTLIYVDGIGSLCFTFDVSPSEGSATKWTLYLDQKPLTEDCKVLECRTQQDRERVAQALQRTKEYTTSRGYDVRVE